MLVSTLSLVLVAAATTASAQQHPFLGGFESIKEPQAAKKLSNGFPTGKEPTYLLDRAVRSVAVIGGGASGLIVARELLDHEFSVRLFERDARAGGVWHYTEETAANPALLNETNVALGDYTPELPGKALPLREHFSSGYSSARRAHRAPKQVWESLHSNAPSPLQQITAWPWPAGQTWKTSQWSIGRYLRSYASWIGLSSDEDFFGEGLAQVSSYNTRVELVEKNEETGKWELTLRRLRPTGGDGFVKEFWKEQFDAVVSTTGRYNSPNVPKIKGLASWAGKWPEQVLHSRSYRRPEVYNNKTVLVVGVSISASEIARDLAQHTAKLYVSVREKKESSDPNTFPVFNRTNQLKRLPANAEVVPEIDQFDDNVGLHHNVTTGTITFKNGTAITGVDAVIYGTGYLYTLPFLPQFHNQSLGANDTTYHGRAPIVTDGTHLRSLYLDTFYIDDPTLALVNYNRLVGDFTWGAYQALAIAKYWKRQIELPSREDQWALHLQRVKERGGFTPTFQFYGALAGQAYTYVVGWLNHAAITYGGKQVDRLPVYRGEIGRYFTAVNFGAQLLEQGGHPEYGDQSVHEEHSALADSSVWRSLDW